MEHGVLMQRSWSFLALVAVLGVLNLFVGCSKTTSTPATDPGSTAGATAPTEPVPVGGDGHTLTGPYTHGKLAVYLVHARERDDRDFITLNEGLENGTVEVTEKESAQVQELIIENRSNYPLYLQEGDRLIGGKQDRMVHTSIAIAPKSGKMPIPTFCIERSRWSAGERGALFAQSSNVGYAPNTVRTAAKLSSSQDKVWREVAQLKAEAGLQLGTANSNTSLNETLDSEQVTKLSKDVAEALGKIAAEHPDSVGVAFAVNGTIEEINIYPGHTLFAKVYPRLLESYAVESALTEASEGETDAAENKPPTLAAVQAFMSEAPGERIRQDKINDDNQLDVYWAKGTATCVTKYNGVSLHRQWLRAEKPTEAAQQEGLQYINRQELQQLLEPQSDSIIQQRQQRNNVPENDSNADQ